MVHKRILGSFYSYVCSTQEEWRQPCAGAWFRKAEERPCERPCTPKERPCERPCTPHQEKTFLSFLIYFSLSLFLSLLSLSLSLSDRLSLSPTLALPPSFSEVSLSHARTEEDTHSAAHRRTLTHAHAHTHTHIRWMCRVIGAPRGRVAV